MNAGLSRGLELFNICVWDKGSGGMGDSIGQHEFVVVFKKPGCAHVNNIELGKHGRYRTNVWSVPGLNRFSKDREELLSLHSTVKPVVLIADAIKDASRRGHIVLDPFCGSGTTLIAAENTGRIARCVELDPLYVDVAVRRFEKRFGVAAINAASGLTFAEEQQLRGEADEAVSATAPLRQVPVTGARRPPPFSGLNPSSLRRA